ncbi:MAG TPA: hypothetical protein VII75_16835 [Thermoanaerobaculia bacterium]|nr:hypothetical protein [Thermoanaerobaculia bacterium]
MAEEEASEARDEVIRLAFELEGKAAVEILLQLGTLDLWRGNLSAMRGDVPASEPETESPIRPDAATRADELYASMFMKDALGYLSPQCREVLYVRYVEHRSMGADELVSACRDRAYKMAEEIRLAPQNDAIGDTPRKTRRAR